MLIKPRLLTPGPTPLLPEGLAAQSLATIHHRTPEFRALFRRTREGLRRFYRLDPGEDVVIFSGSGSLGMEAALVNGVAPGATVVVATAGKFGERWLKLARAYGLNVIAVERPYGEAITAEDLRRALESAGPVAALCVQEHESSTGVRHPVKELAAAFRQLQPDGVVIVDGITGVGVHDVRLADGIDALVCSSQKALALQPGITFVALSARYRAALDQQRLPRFYLDIRQELKAHDGDGTAWTPAIGLIAALSAALDWLEARGGVQTLIDNAALQARAFRAALTAWDLPGFAKRPGNALTAVCVADSTRLLKALRDRFGLSLANGQGELEGKIVRVAHLGYTDAIDTLSVVSALETAFTAFGVSYGSGGSHAAQAVLAERLRG
jgi:aspartate aminotransferase-like enzyme